MPYLTLRERKVFFFAATKMKMVKKSMEKRTIFLKEQVRRL
jgi:hypothetical protein